MNDRIDTYLDRTMAGLADDPELQLEMRAELAGHVEDASDRLRADGVADDELADAVLKRLGDGVAVGEDLQQANAWRMHWRGRVRAAMKLAAIPLALIAAVLCVDLRGLRFVRKLYDLNEVRLTNGYLWQDMQDPLDGSLGTRRLTPEQRFLLYGDESRRGRLERQRAIWEAQPDSVPFLNNHLTSVEELSGNLHWFRPPPEREQESTTDVPITPEQAFAPPDPIPPTFNPTTWEKLRRDLEEARLLDPDNARPDYIEAGFLIEAGAGIDKVDGVYTLSVVDRELLDQGMGLLLEATSRPEFRRYNAEVLRLRFDALPPARTSADINARMMFAYGTLLPGLQHLRNTALASALYADLLAREGAAEGALTYAMMWHDMAQHLASDTGCLIDGLVARAIVALGIDYGCPVLRALGHTPRADEFTNQHDILRQAAETLKTPKHSISPSEWRRSMPACEALLRVEPGGDWCGSLPTAEASRSALLAEYALLTRQLLSLTTVVLAMLCGTGVGVSAWTRWRGGKDAPAAVLLLLPGREWAKAILFGVLLPFGLFLLVTRYAPFSGHRFSLIDGFPGIITEFALLASALCVGPTLVAMRWLNRRCGDLGIASLPHPVRNLGLVWGIGASALLFTWAVSPVWDQSAVPMPFLLGVTVWLCGAGVLLVRALRCGQTYRRCVATLARSLVPVYAAVAVAIAIVAQPAFRLLEQRYVANDGLRAWTDTGRCLPGMLRTEVEATHALRTEVEAFLRATAD